MSGRHGMLRDLIGPAVALGVCIAVVFGALYEDIRAVAVGFGVGLLAFFVLLHDPKRGRQDSESQSEDFPEALVRLEVQYRLRGLFILPTIFVVFVALSWLIVGSALWGLLPAFLASYVVKRLLARFGGPDDPAWKSAREKSQGRT
jgi:hypothetical protein